jgi:hypothetical protein
MQGAFETAVLDREIGPAAGGRRADGTVFAGVSPDSGRPLYVTPADIALTVTFNQAQDHAAALGALAAHGYNDWRLPTKNELKMIFDNRAAIGGFDQSGVLPGGWYWSLSQDASFSAWCQRFSDGKQAPHGVDMLSALRPVRG